MGLTLRVMEPADPPLTELIERARLGDDAAAETLFPLVYDQLRAIAAVRRRAQGGGETLNTTALVHEAYLRLVGREAPIESTRHFYALAARAMRSALVDCARRRAARKRGGSGRRMPLEEALAWFDERAIDLEALDAALSDLERLDGRKFALVQLRFFAGLSSHEAAETLGVSVATAERDWTFSRAWLKERLG